MFLFIHSIQLFLGAQAKRGASNSLILQEGEEEEGEERGETDDGGLDLLSMAANGGLTDAEGAMSG